MTFSKAFIFSCDQATLWLVQSICPSGCTSVHLTVTLFLLFPSLYHYKIYGLQLQFEFTQDYQIMHKACTVTEEVAYVFSRLSVKFPVQTEQKIAGFPTVTQVWIVFLGHLSNFKVKQDNKLLILAHIGHFQTVTPVWITQIATEWCTKLEVEQMRCPIIFFNVICQISRSQGTNNCQFWPELLFFWIVTPVWIYWLFWNNAQSWT